MGTVVGIDIETTSLDPTAGEIIEVAAIRFNLATGQEEGRFETLCRPSHLITPQITAITGITAEMVASASPFSEHIAELERFLADDLLFAHNARFDLSWLHFHGCSLPQPVWDTFPLAGVAWPEAESYNLGTLARDLGITITGEHRAAADIILTWELLQRIRKTLKMTTSTEKKVKRLLHVSGQEHYLELFTVGNVTAKEMETKAKAAEKLNLKEATVFSVLGPDGALEQSLPGFQSRPEQVLLAEKISESVRTKASAIIEAPSGIGKTFAYLTSALLTPGRLLISTHTRVLQDQLVEKDIPALLSSLGIHKRIAVLKGRRNYICSTQLRKMTERKHLTPEETWILIKILLWLDSGGTGDIERLNLSHQPGGAIYALTANTATCSRQCENCPYQRSREAAKAADITVINHALLLRAALGEDNLSNAYQVLIVDEGHRLEDAAVSASESELSTRLLQELLDTLRSLITHEKITEECRALTREFEALQDKSAILLKSHTQDNRLRLSQTIRRSHTFQKVKEAAEMWLARFAFVLGLARSQEESIKKENSVLYKETIRRTEKFRLEFEELLKPSSKDRVQWIESSLPSEEVNFHDAALAIAPYISQCLTMIQPTIVISATLTAETGFQYIKNRFGIEDWPEFQLPSPFNYAEQMGVFIVEDGPVPSDPDFDQFVAQVIEKVSEKTRGRLLGLFTSQSSLGNVHEMLASRINKGKTRILSQKISGGRHNIAKRFRDEHSSILLGTHSFWDGFDSPGETLSVLVIPKLPFSQPTDPILEGLSEQAGNGAFERVMLPRMILQLKQGVGRLIRSTTDRGVVVFLDKRLVEKRYGRGVLHSLPDAPIETVSQREIADRVEEYFGPATIARWQKTP